MRSRRQAREAALQMLYQMDLSGAAPEDVVRLYWTHLSGHAPEGEEFANALVLGCGHERDTIDALIREVSHHWRLERMSRVDRNILRLGAYELLRMPDVPRRVTLNEAVELAKRYGSEGSSGFVNGVLDRIAGDVDKE
jgi:transcription antitermination protein NusB